MRLSARGLPHTLGATTLVGACLATLGVVQPRESLAAAMVRGQPTTSQTCGRCHRDIFAMWQVSAHAHALDDTIFQDALDETAGREGAGVERLCLKCHAPLMEVNGDVKRLLKVTWEGVSCDVCHSLASVDVSGPNPKLVLDVGPVKRGPIKDAASGAHEVAYSELHSTALACAGCHEYVNPEGTAVITTWSEWKASGASREGKPCQACHMGATRASVVDPRVKRVARAEVNLHEVPGGHSLDQLHRALLLSFDPHREGGSLVVDLSLANKGAGHAVPTGMPGRRIILDVKVQTDQGQTFEERRVYSKLYKDAAGAVITHDSGYFGKSIRLASDSRIGAGETRRERFHFDVPDASAAYVTVELHYEHAPTGGPQGRTWITFQSEKRTLPAERASTR